MKGAMIVALLFAAVLMLPLAAAPDRLERNPPRDTPIVETGSTLRFDGGQWVHVRIGDVSLGVLWTTNDSLRKGGVSLFLDYKRFFGAAELYDEQGNYLGTRPLPLHTVLAQHFDRMFEFVDGNDDGLFDLRPESRNWSAQDRPVKFLDLTTGWSLDGAIDQTVTNDSASVSFTLSATGLLYTHVWDNGSRTWRNGTAADGRLEKVSLTFHLSAAATDGSVVVPFYKVTVADGNPRTPTSSSFLENRTLTGTSITVDGKYDQRIEGWDFVADPKAKLGMATGLAFGNYISEPIVQWIQQQFGGACLRDGSFDHCESDAGPTAPVPIARDHLQIGEDWHRAGDWYWTSGVTVDGVPATMTFEIYAAERVPTRDAGLVYNGFRAYGGFVYPQGQLIVHDPGLTATSVLAAITGTTNVAPSFLVLLQLAVVGLALVPAVFLRRRSRKGSR